MVGMPNPGKANAQPAVPEDTADPSCGTDPALVGCWLFNEGTGAATVDGSSNTNNGTLVGNVSDNMWVPDRFGYAGKALLFNGSSQYVQIPDANILDITGDITIAAWEKPAEVKTQDVVKKAVNGATDGYELALSSASGSCAVSGATPPCAFGRFNQVANADGYRIDSKTQYSGTDPWTFYVVTYTTADNTIRLYWNGTLSNSRVVSGLTIATNSLYLGFGAELTAAGVPTVARIYHGSLDDVRIFSRALSLAEIQTLYNAPAAVNLVDFRASSRPQAIQLDWQTAQETDLLGFNLYRAEALDGPQVKINPQLIPAINPGQLQGNNYKYLDATADIGRTYYYWAEWVGNSSSQLYGPETANIAAYWLWLPIGLK
jgi:hypothetical protein